MAKKLFELRVQKRPYIIPSVISVPLVILIVFVDLKNPVSIEMIVMTSLIFLVVGYLYATLWAYRIVLFEDVLVDRGFMKRKNAPVSAITKLKLEAGYRKPKWLGKQKWFGGSMLQPYYRFSIYYKLDNKKQYIDISLIHFSIEEVRNLLNGLLCLRPDLELPKNFIKAKSKRKLKGD